MFNSSELSDELQSAQERGNGDGVFDAAKNRADVLADQIKAALSELGETLSEQERHVEALIAERPIATMASAFALSQAQVRARQASAPQSTQALASPHNPKEHLRHVQDPA
jgi:hypothetical protein